MQSGRVLGALPRHCAPFFLRRGIGVASVVLNQFSRPAWQVAMRGCATRNEVNQLESSKDAGAATNLATKRLVGEDTDWDDNSILEDIRCVLCSELLPGEGTPQAGNDNSLPLHTLFRALGPMLRLRLQNSSFGALANALKSRPSWFALSSDGSKVGLTEEARSYRAEIQGTDELNENGVGGRQRHEAGRSKTVVVGGDAETCSFKERKKLPTKHTVVVRGCFVSTPVDVSKPPLTSDELEKWKLTRLILPLTLHFLLDGEPVTFFPHGEKPRCLSPDLAEIEDLYVSKGQFPPSEVAAAFVHITPTFFVETRHVLAAMSPDVAQRLERRFPKDRVVDGFFKKYPMIFKLKLGRVQKAAVKLNLDFSFIRNYPGCGMADRPLRRHNQEYRATVGGVVARPLTSSSGETDSQGRRLESHVDVKIFEILVRNLPRFPTDASLSRLELEEKRCAPFPLVGWIDGFSQEDLEVLNSVPQQRVLTLLTRYSHIFQLLCRGEDANLFAEHRDLASVTNSSLTRRTHQGVDTKGNVVSPSNSESVCDLHDPSHANTLAVEQEKTDNMAANTSHASDAERQRRDANITAALRDDLLGMDDILSGSAESMPAPPPEGADTEPGDTLNAAGEDEMNAAEGEQEGDLFTEHDVEEGACYDKDEERTTLKERGRDAAKKDAPSPIVSAADDENDGPYIPSRYDILYVRRLPKRIAPRSLSDYNATNSPEPELLRHIASFLNPPPSLQGTKRLNLQLEEKSPAGNLFSSGSSSGPWRWVPIQRIYASLNREQKRLLRPLKGLVHFMRLHGEIFELSTDLLHVIAHDPEGQIPPFVPTQMVFHSEDRVLLPQTFDDDEKSKVSLIADSERTRFERILGASQIPTDRRQLLLLDPLNPLLHHEILCEEVSFFMPDHPVSHIQLLTRLPPILKAALSVRHKNNFRTSRHLTVWMDGSRMMLQKSQLAVPESARAGEETIPVEDAIEALREVIPDEGVLIGYLNRMLPSAAKRTLKTHFGNIYNAVLGYPQYFYLEKVEGSRANSTVFLVERLQEEE
ncbi:uncharacterized protein Tco025E_06980 [Trypanosoma conorhini]|uniref:Uncharacterized protein n=1 Tax=Trypanosoma conorhini TaxID=83891 RepID=A0A3S5IRZ7_9TRYP|nr:uncharacterized protein Tco025E_06980 [Trypanosoma conorhini]RNF09427.1 hypothetical protein Tco025E_06980 [Trypanosoma conorhini]